MVFAKSPKGSATKARRKKSAALKRREHAIMREALERDGFACRRCGDRPADPAHMIHRGMGGNPAGDRTQRHLIIALCRKCHQAYDAAKLEIEPLTDSVFDGPVRFREI